jgi:hypothetical protein
MDGVHASTPLLAIRKKKTCEFILIINHKIWSAHFLEKMLNYYNVSHIALAYIRTIRGP